MNTLIQMETVIPEENLKLFNHILNYVLSSCPKYN